MFSYNYIINFFNPQSDNRAKAAADNPVAIGPKPNNSPITPPTNPPTSPVTPPKISPFKLLFNLITSFHKVKDD